MFIFIVSLLLSTALAVTGSLTFWKVDQPYEFYIPIVLFLAGYLASIIIWWIVIWCFGRVYSNKKIYTKPSKWAKFWLNQGLKWLMIHARISIKVIGKNKVPNKPFLLVCNHRSRFDPMTLIPTLGKKQIAFISKESNFKIPLFAKFMRGCCYLAIDRSDPLQSLEIMKRASDLISNGYSSVCVYPEGTRQTGEILGEFHEGVFNIALRAKCPIVVVTTTGTETVAKLAPFRKSRVKINILGVLDYSYLEGKTAKAISDKVHSIMKQNLERALA